MAKTSIEWSDEVLSRKGFVNKAHTILDLIFNFSVRCNRPLKNVRVFFGRVACLTGWNNISRFCNAALTNRNDVIPCSRGIIAISAKPIKVIENHFLANYRNWINTAFTRMGMLFSRCIDGRALVINLSRIFVPVHFAHSTFYFHTRKPGRAKSTPCKTSSTLDISLAFARVLSICSRAINTYCGKPASPCGVFVKRIDWFPGFTFRTPLQPIGNHQVVIINTYANSLCGCFPGAC